MKKYLVTLESQTPLVYGKSVQEPKKERESHQDYEERTWEHRAHTDLNGNLIIPPMAMKNSISEAAKYLSKQIPGKGKNTYTKHFEAGLRIMDNIVLENHGQFMKQTMFVPSDGKRGGSTRVIKHFPTVVYWKAQFEIMVLDEIITQSVLEEHLRICGSLIGVLAFRPRKNGMHGTFNVLSVKGI